MKTNKQPDCSGGIELRGDEVSEFLWWMHNPDQRKTDLFLALGKRAASALAVNSFSDSELRGIAWSACLSKDTEFGRQLFDELASLNVEEINVHNAFWRAWAKDKETVSKLVKRITSPGELEAMLKLVTQRPTAGDEATIKAHTRLVDKLKPSEKFAAFQNRLDSVRKRINGQN